jgi:hypothetical protein
MDPVSLVANRQLIAEAANATVIYEQFVADGRRFTVACLGYVPVLEVLKGLAGASALERGQHIEALNEGFPVMLRFAAIGDDGNVYAVWEVYAAENNSSAAMVSKTLQVDGDWTGRGIGANFAYVVRQNLPVQWSDKFTEAGAKLKERVEAMEEAAAKL